MSLANVVMVVLVFSIKFLELISIMEEAVVEDHTTPPILEVLVVLVAGVMAVLLEETTGVLVASITLAAVVEEVQPTLAAVAVAVLAAQV